VALFVAALYTKQSFLFAPLAAVGYLLFFVDRRWAFRLATAMALAGGGLFVLLNGLTGGGFWYGLVASNVNPFLWPEFWRQLGDFAGTYAILGLLTVAYVAHKFLLNRTTPWTQRISLLDCYLVVALGSLWFAGKAGAWENYFFEALVALALCTGLMLVRYGVRPPSVVMARSETTKPTPLGLRNGFHAGWWGALRSARTGTLLTLVAPVLILIQLGLMWHTPRAAERYLQLVRQSNRDMKPILARTPDPVASEDMGLLVTNGKVLDFCSFQYSQLARAGRWDQAWELDRLRSGGFSVVILEEGTRLDVDRYQRFTREFLSELDRNYHHTRTVGKYELYEFAPLQHERRAEYGDQLALVGWSLHAPPWPSAGDTIGLTVVWQAQHAMKRDHTAFAHLVDDRGQGWAGDDHSPYDGLYPTSAWGPGEMVRDTFTLTLPADVPPGLYDVRVGWYPSQSVPAGAPASPERLPVGEGSDVRVAVLPVDWETTGSGPVIPVRVQFDEGITLESFAWQVEPTAIHVTLRWSTAVHLDVDYTVFVHLVSSAGERALAQDDAPPLGGRWPTSLWLPDMPLDDLHTIPLPSDLLPGTYDLLVGLYDPRTGERQHLPDGADRVRLPGIELP
jgi:hypothetical protein